MSRIARAVAVRLRTSRIRAVGGELGMTTAEKVAAEPAETDDDAE